MKKIIKQVVLDCPDGSSHPVIVKYLKYSKKYNCNFICYLDNERLMFIPLEKINGIYYANTNYSKEMITSFAKQTLAEVTKIGKNGDLDTLPEHIKLSEKKNLPKSENVECTMITTSKGIKYFVSSEVIKRHNLNFLGYTEYNGLYRIPEQEIMDLSESKDTIVTFYKVICNDEIKLFHDVDNNDYYIDVKDCAKLNIQLGDENYLHQLTQNELRTLKQNPNLLITISSFNYSKDNVKNKENNSKEKEKRIFYLDEFGNRFIDDHTLEELKKITDYSKEEDKSPYKGLHQISGWQYLALGAQLSLIAETLKVIYYDVKSNKLFVSEKVAKLLGLEAINGLYKETAIGKLYQLSDNDCQKIKEINNLYQRKVSMENSLTMKVVVNDSKDESTKYLAHHVALTESGYYNNNSSNYFYIDMASLKQYLETHELEIVTTLVVQNKNKKLN